MGEFDTERMHIENYNLHKVFLGFYKIISTLYTVDERTKYLKNVMQMSFYM